MSEEPSPSHEIERIVAQAITGRNASQERENLLQRLDASRRDMEALLLAILPSHEIYPGWKKKEVVAHLTGWEDGSLGSLQAMLAGTPPKVPAALRGPDYYNAQSVIERSELTYEQVVQEWRLARQQFSELVRAMTSEEFDNPLIFPWGLSGTVTDAILGLIAHEQEHIRQIRALME